MPIKPTKGVAGTNKVLNDCTASGNRKRKLILQVQVLSEFLINPSVAGTISSGEAREFIQINMKPLGSKNTKQ